MGATGMESWAPIRKVLAGTLGGLPVAALVPVVLSTLGVSLPAPVVGLIGAGLVSLISYAVRSAPGEAGSPPPPPAHYAPIDPDA